VARFKLHGKVYAMSALDEVSLKDVVLFNSQAEEIGLRRKWSDVERVAVEIAEMPPDEADAHPEKLLAIAVTIWATRRVAGDSVTFGEAIDFPMNAIDFLPDTEDRRPGKRKGAKTAPAKKARTPRASAPAAEPLESDAPPTT